MDAVSNLWSVLLLTVPVEAFVECIDTWTDWSGTTFTFVLLGLFFPVFNLLFSLAIGAILRRLHVAKMKQEITQAVEEDVYLNPAFHGGVALASLAREAEARREKIKARVAKRAEEAASRRKGGAEGPTRPGAFAKKARGKNENQEGLPRAAMAAQDVQQRRAAQQQAKLQKKEKKKKKVRGDRGFERRVAVQEKEEPAADASKATDMWTAQAARRALQAPEPSDSYYSSSFHSSEPVPSSAGSKKFQAEAQHAATPSDRGEQASPQTEDARGSERDVHLEEGGEEDDLSDEGEDDEDMQMKRKKIKSAMPPMHTSDLYGYWKWVFAVFFVLHYCCLVTIGKCAGSWSR